MNCPDCKKPMIKLDVFCNGTPCEPIWKCMRCKLEIDEETINSWCDIEEEEK